MDTVDKTINKTKFPLPEQAFQWALQAAQENNWEVAAQRWEVLRQAYPEHPATWLQNAIAHIEIEDFTHAEYLLTHAHTAFPNHPLTLTESAFLAIRKKHWAVAEDFLQQARQKHPDFVQTWLKSSLCAESMGDLDQATVYSKRACQCDTDIPGPFIQYAELAMRNEQWEQALDRWEQLRTHFPKLPIGYLRAADAARKLNDPKLARQFTLAHQYGIDLVDTEPNNADSTKDDPKNQNASTRKHIEHNGASKLLDLIWTKAIFNLRSEDHHNYLSYLWWILEPLIHMSIYYLVFGYLLDRGGENFPVFLLTGLIPWMWFMKAVTSSSNSIVAGQHLMLQVGLPSIVFPLVNLIQATLKQIPVFILLFVFLWMNNITPNVYWWALIPVIVVQILLTVALASFVAAVVPFMRDLSYLVPTGMTLLMFLSGIFYDYHMIPAEWHSTFLLNPIAFLLQSYRDIFIGSTLPDMLSLTLWGIASSIACFALLHAYKQLRYVYPRILME